MAPHWSEAIAYVNNHVFLIETPSGQGTAFFIQPPKGLSGTFVGTAFHVIEHANKFGEQILLTHFVSQKKILLTMEKRIIHEVPSRDQAIIEFRTDMILPPSAMPLGMDSIKLPGGFEIGWVGFPSVAPTSLCFFHGYISAWLDNEKAYLVDGTAINGVSGGPAFAFLRPGNPVFIGLVTEYRPNISLGTPLPGLSLIRSIDPLKEFYNYFANKNELAKLPKPSK